MVQDTQLTFSAPLQCKVTLEHFEIMTFYLTKSMSSLELAVMYVLWIYNAETWTNFRKTNFGPYHWPGQPQGPWFPNKEVLLTRYLFTHFCFFLLNYNYSLIETVSNSPFSVHAFVAHRPWEVQVSPEGPSWCGLLQQRKIPSWLVPSFYASPHGLRDPADLRGATPVPGTCHEDLHYAQL